MNNPKVLIMSDALTSTAAEVFVLVIPRFRAAPQGGNDWPSRPSASAKLIAVHSAVQNQAHPFFSNGAMISVIPGISLGFAIRMPS